MKLHEAEISAERSPPEFLERGRSLVRSDHVRAQSVHALRGGPVAFKDREDSYGPVTAACGRDLNCFAIKV
jgi:hypothetical protein